MDELPTITFSGPLTIDKERLARRLSDALPHWLEDSHETCDGGDCPQRGPSRADAARLHCADGERRRIWRHPAEARYGGDFVRIIG